MANGGFEDSDFGEVEWLRPAPAEPPTRKGLWAGVAIVAAPVAVALLHLLRTYA